MTKWSDEQARERFEAAVGDDYGPGGPAHLEPERLLTFAVHRVGRALLALEAERDEWRAKAEARISVMTTAESGSRRISQLEAQVKALQSERDDAAPTAKVVAQLRQQVKALTGERDALVGDIEEYVRLRDERGDAARREVEALREQKDDAYAQRNRLAMLLAAEHGGTLARAVPEEPGWTSVLLIPTAAGQISFHVHDSELPAILSCPAIKLGGEWDGHSDDEKWSRVAGAARAAAPRDGEAR